MSAWQDIRRRTAHLVHMIFGAGVVAALGVAFGVPPPIIQGGDAVHALFLMLLAWSLLSFPFAAVLGGERMSAQRVVADLHGDADPEHVIRLAVAQFRTGALIMALIGASCALAGLLFYLLSGDRQRPCIFNTRSGLQYLLTRRALRQAGAELTPLMES